MKLTKSRMIAVFLLFVFVAAATAAQSYRDVTFVIVRYIHWGQLTYSYNFAGVDTLMNDLEVKPGNKDLFEKMKAPYLSMKAKNDAQNTLTGLSWGGGAAIVAAGLVVILLAPQEEPFSSPTWSSTSDKRRSAFLGGAAISLGGILAGMGGLSIAGSSGPNEQDVQNFVNRWNIASPEDQLSVR